MAKRGFKFGTYDTATKGWTLTEWDFQAPELIENYIDVPGRLDGPLDASTALTNGDPRYGARKLTATFECSEGTRLNRKYLIHDMQAWIDGLRLDIVLPDDAGMHINGRCRVETLYNDPAHASVRVTAVCEPWRYYDAEIVVNLTAEASTKTEILVNGGRRTVIPSVTVTGGSVNFSGINGCDGVLGQVSEGFSGYSMSEGTRQIPDFIIYPKETYTFKYSGTGTIKLTYREAVL